MTAVRPHPADHPETRHPSPGLAATLPPVRVGPVLVATVLALGLVVALWLGVVMHAGLSLVDPIVTGGVVAARPPGLAMAALVVTTVGGPGPMIALLVVVVSALAWRRRSWWPAVVGAGGLAALTVVDLGVKAVVARPRPPEAWFAVAANGGSFPSGHAMFAAGVLLLLVWMVAPRGALRAAIALGAAVLVAVAVGASRVVLGVHYPSDVLAGWALAVITDGGVLLVLTLGRNRARSALHRAAASNPPV